MPVQQVHRWGGDDLRYGVKLDRAMLAGERIKTARQNREINQFRLESEKEEKERAEANRQRWLDVKSPEEARKAFDQDPIYGAKIMEARQAMDDAELAQKRQYFGGIVQKLEPIVNLPREQRPQAWDAMWQSLPPGTQKDVPREYDERSVVAWIKQARGGALSFKAYEDERKAVKMEKQRQKGRVELEKVKQRLKTSAAKTSARSGQKWERQITSDIRTAVNDLFNKTKTAWDMSEMDTTGMDPDRHKAHRISQEAIRMMISGEQTQTYAAITAAAKKNGVDVDPAEPAKPLAGTEENIKNTFLKAATAP